MTDPRAYFGEWAADIREKAGGLRDRIKKPRAFLGSINDPLPIKRHDNNLEITVKGRGDLRLVEDAISPRDDKERGGQTRTIYYAKTGRSETAAKLDLEFVPTTANGNQFVVLFNGDPLSKAELTVYGPPKWEKKLTTDERGSVTIPSPWPGLYLLEIVHFDETAGDLGVNCNKHPFNFTLASQRALPARKPALTRRRAPMSNPRIEHLLSGGAELRCYPVDPNLASASGQTTGSCNPN